MPRCQVDRKLIILLESQNHCIPLWSVVIYTNMQLMLIAWHSKDVNVVSTRSMDSTWQVDIFFRSLLVLYFCWQALSCDVAVDWKIWLFCEIIYLSINKLLFFSLSLWQWKLTNGLFSLISAEMWLVESIGSWFFRLILPLSWGRSQFIDCLRLMKIIIEIAQKWEGKDCSDLIEIWSTCYINFMTFHHLTLRTLIPLQF